MGILNWSNALSFAGGAAAQVGLEGVRASLDQQKLELASRLAEQRTIAAEQRAPSVAASTETAVGQAKEGLLAKNAVAARERKLAEAKALDDQARAATTDPKNVEAQAKAEAQRAEILATSKARVDAELQKDPNYLKSIEALTKAQHPEKQAQIAASLASQALSEYKLGQEKLVADARKELAAAATPEAKSAAKAKIEALEWSVSSDRARAAADASVITALEKVAQHHDTIAGNAASSPAQITQAQADAARTRSTIDALREQYAKDRGLPEGAPAVAKPKTEAEVLALPPGAKYIDPGDGKTYARPAASVKPTPAAPAEPAAPAIPARPAKAGVLDRPADVAKLMQEASTGGGSAIIDRVRAKYPNVAREGATNRRTGVKHTEYVDSPEVAALKRLSGEEFAKKAAELLR